MCRNFNSLGKFTHLQRQVDFSRTLCLDSDWGPDNTLKASLFYGDAVLAWRNVNELIKAVGIGRAHALFVCT